MAVFSSKHNYLYFASPLTGSKAIANALIEKVDGEQIPKNEIKRKGKLIAAKQHTTYKMLLNAELLSQRQLDQAFKVGSVRNPFDQQVSRYLKLKGRFAEAESQEAAQPKKDKRAERMQSAGELDFPQWLAEVHKEFIGLDGIIRPVRGPMMFLEHVDHVIRFESLQQDFDAFMKRLGVKETISVVQPKAPAEGAKPNANANANTDYREFYDPASIELCAQLYAPVIEKFGYKFDPQ